MDHKTEHKHDAKFYWDKHKLVEEQWNNAIECLDENSSSLFVGELLAVHKLMEVLEECAKEYERHDKHDGHEMHDRQTRTSDTHSDMTDNPRRHSARA